MTENYFTKTAAAVLTIAGVLGIGYQVAKYATDFDAAKAEIENLRGQVTQLQDILQKAQTAAAATGRGIQGPKGDQGDTGPQGPRGAIGAQGERGIPGIAGNFDQAELKSTVQTLIDQKLASIPQNTGGAPAGSLDIAAALAAFNTSNCIQWNAIKGLKVLTLRPKMEVCRSDGGLVGRVEEITDNGHVSMTISGSGSEGCSLGNDCNWRLLGNARYIFERAGSDDSGPIALLRKVE